MRILELGVEIYLRSQRILGLEGCNVRGIRFFRNAARASPLPIYSGKQQTAAICRFDASASMIL
jgi:hypothetical protein